MSTKLSSPAAGNLSARALRRVDHTLRAGAAHPLFRRVPYIPPKRIFAVLPRLYRPELGGPATGILEVRVMGRGGGTWTLDLAADSLRVTSGPAPQVPDTRITLDSKIWTQLATRRTIGTEAFMRGSIAVEGDLSLTLKLDACFTPEEKR